MIPLVETADYEVSTIYFESKVLVDFPDGSSAFLKHRKIKIIFKSVKGPKLEILMTNRMNFYRQVWMDPKTERITQEEALKDFKRLIGKGWELAFKTAKVRMALGI